MFRALLNIFDAKFLQKTASWHVEVVTYFFKNAPSYISERVLNTPLKNITRDRITIQISEKAERNVEISS